MKKPIIIFLSLFFSLLSFYSFAQSISPAVLSTAATYDSTAEISVSGTVGQIGIFDYIESDSAGISSGFHQGDLNITALEPRISDKDLLIYPNPTTNKVIIESNYSGLQTTLIDISGKEIFSEKTDIIGKLEIPFQHLPSGYYQLITKKGSFSIIKK